MRYAPPVHHHEDVVCAWNKEEDATVMQKLAAVHEPLARAGKLGPVARQMPTTAAATLRTDREPPLVLDGAFAETKEQLLGFDIVDYTLQHGAVGTRVTWEKSGRTPFIGKVMSLFINRDDTTGRDFDKDLVRLKALVEGNAPKARASAS